MDVHLFITMDYLDLLMKVISVDFARSAVKV